MNSCGTIRDTSLLLITKNWSSTKVTFLPTQSDITVLVWWMVGTCLDHTTYIYQYMYESPAETHQLNHNENFLVLYCNTHPIISSINLTVISL